MFEVYLSHFDEVLIMFQDLYAFTEIKDSLWKGQLYGFS